jgi:hypothetical protein
MSGDVSDKKRLVALTIGNLSNNHIYISGHHDFFPKESYGNSNESNGIGKELTLDVLGLDQKVLTDISVNGSNGKPRNFFRRRWWVGRFFEKHHLQAGHLFAT